MLMIKKKNQNEKKTVLENPTLKLIEVFEKAHPEGVKAYTDGIITFFAKMNLDQVNKYNAMSVNLNQLHDKKLQRLSLQQELDTLKSLSADKDIPDEDATQDQELIPEEKNLPNRPTLIQEVKDLVCDSKAGGITEASLNRMELFIIRMNEAVREYLNWMRRVILKIKDCNRIPRMISSEIREMIKLLNKNLKLSEDNTAQTSFDKDPNSVSRNFSHPQMIDQIYSSDTWELAYVESCLEVI